MKKNVRLRTVLGFAALFFTMFIMFGSFAGYSRADDCVNGSTVGGGVLGSTVTNKNCDPVLDAKFNNPIGIDDLNTFIAKILEIAIKIGIPICVFFMIYSGFLFVTARGNEEQLTKAKKNFLYTVIGVAILLGAWAIAKAIQGTVSQLSYHIINSINLFV